MKSNETQREMESALLNLALASPQVMYVHRRTLAQSQRFNTPAEIQYLFIMSKDSQNFRARTEAIRKSAEEKVYKKLTFNYHNISDEFRIPDGEWIFHRSDSN